MNENTFNLTVYYSKLNLTTRLNDMSNVYLLPSICLFGMITSFLTIVVSYDRNLNSNIFKYMFVNSIADMLFLLTQFFLIIIRCGILCPYGFTYLAKFYEIYIYLFLGYVLITFEVLLDISVSFNRLMTIIKTGKQRNELSFNVKSVIFVVVSFVLNSVPYAITKEVVAIGVYKSDPNSTRYEILYGKTMRDVFKPEWGRYLSSAFTLVKGPVLLTMFCIVNVVLAVKFHQHLEKKKALTFHTIKPKVSDDGSNEGQKRNVKQAKTKNKRDNKATLMILFICFIYSVGNFLDTFSLLFDIFSIDLNAHFEWLMPVGNVLLFLSHSINFFIYFLFNVTFRRKFYAKFSFLNNNSKTLKTTTKLQTNFSKNSTIMNI